MPSMGDRQTVPMEEGSMAIVHAVRFSRSSTTTTNESSLQVVQDLSMSASWAVWNERNLHSSRRCRRRSFALMVPSNLLAMASFLVILLLVCSISLVGAQTSVSPSDVPSMSPTGAPSPSSANVPCNICGGDLVVGNPDQEVRDPVNGDTVTCAELQERGELGWYTPVQCAIIELAVFNPCGCEEPPPPTVVPTTAVPSMPRPTPAPTLPLQPQAANLAVELDSVRTTMPQSVQTDLSTQTTMFYIETLANVTPPIVNIQTMFDGQSFTAGTRRRRNLQDLSELSPITAFLTVTADQRGINPGFEQLLAETINSNPDLYLTYLRNSSTVQSQVYFRPVTSVSAQVGSTPTASPSLNPTAPSPSGGSSGLSSGAIAGIAVGAVIGVALMGGAIYYTQFRKPNGNGLAVVTSGSGDTMDAGRRSETTGLVAAADAPAQRRSTRQSASSRSSQPQYTSDEYSQEPSAVGAGATSSVPSDLESQQSGFDTSHLGTSMAGTDDASYAYSLDAGNVTATSDVRAMGGSTDDSAASKKYTRTVVAPAGKLGIVIDTTLEGPVVHKVNPGSPLEGVLFTGDVIIAIDDVDTRAMSASSITALMIKTAGQKRNLTVQSDDPNR